MGRNDKTGTGESRKARSGAAGAARCKWDIAGELGEFRAKDAVVPVAFVVVGLVAAAGLFVFGYSGLSGSTNDYVRYAALVLAAVIVLAVLAVSGSIVRTRRELKLSAIEANKEIKVELIRWLAGGPDEAVVKLVIGDLDGFVDREEDAEEADTFGAAEADSPSVASATAVESDAPDGPSGSSAKPPAQSGDSAIEPNRRSAT
ncbi:MAG TPA: hypothetical protein K8U80_06750 [Collinsella ihuae]|uniref:Uncharacterized protein n=1 Tax=Collinsella ihumii TaxID=1720204 RepID=A0A921ISM3_9ACTN|nr:hypothetical protein [Collinsella ihumii]